MASLIKKQELIKTYNEQKEILKIKQSAYQTADDVDADNVMDLYDEYKALKKVVLEMEAQIAEMNDSDGGSSSSGGGSGGGGGGGGGGGAHWANDDKSETKKPVAPTPVVVPPTPVVVPPVVPPTPVVVPPTPVVVPPTPVCS